jgi:universal stress protein E
MPDQPRFMLVVSHQMENTPAFDRAAALAKASGQHCTSSHSIT